MPNLLDDLLNSRIVLFFVGLAFFIKILGSTQDPSVNNTKHYEKDNALRDYTIQYLMDEIKEQKREIELLKEALRSTRIEKGKE